MSKPVFEDLFSFQGRRNRQSYLLYGLAIFGAIFALAFVLGAGGFPIVALVLFAPLYVSAFAVGTQRLRDIDLSGWWIFLNFVPLVGTVFALYVIIKRGTHGANRFGPDPLGPGRMDEHW